MSRSNALLFIRWLVLTTGMAEMNKQSLQKLKLPHFMIRYHKIQDILSWYLIPLSYALISYPFIQG